MTAPAVFIGWQERPAKIHRDESCIWFEQRGPVALYNLTADIPGHPAGSTVAAETLAKAGYEVPPATEETTI